MHRVPSRSWYPLAVAILALLATGSNVVGAQSVADVRLTSSVVTAGGYGCTLFGLRSPDLKGKEAKADDSLRITIFKDTSWKEKVVAGAALSIDYGAGKPTVVAATATDKEITLPPNDLTGRVITISREDGNRPICELMVRPAVAGVARLGNRSTQFIADGAVNTGLRSGGQGQATGSLGIDHRDIKVAGENRHFIAIPILTRVNGKLGIKRKPVFRLSQEHLRALVTVASSVDTLTSAKPAEFREAFLSPSTSARGRAGSAFLGYQISKKFLDGHHGPRAAISFSRATWSMLNTDSVFTGVRRDTAFTSRASLASVDVRYRYTPIEQVQDAKGNDFSFAVEAGWSWRMIGGDARGLPKFLDNTLGTSQVKFSGPALGFAITLRQVTATADVPFMRSKNGHLAGLSGMQPLLTINFSAPLFRY